MNLISFKNRDIRVKRRTSGYDIDLALLGGGHKGDEEKERERRRAKLRFMPESKPDLNPKRLLHPVGEGGGTVRNSAEQCGTVRNKIRADT